MRLSTVAPALAVALIASVPSSAQPADPLTPISWEKGRAEPEAPFLPKILAFLGHGPRPGTRTPATPPA
jgi:hypothetical protein